MITADDREDRVTGDAPADPTRGDNAEDGAPIEPHAPGSGPLTAEEHRAAMAARPREPAPKTVEDALFANLRKAVAGDPTHKPSAPDPLTRIESGPNAKGKYTPPVSLDPRNVQAIEGYKEHQGYVDCAVQAFSSIHGALQRLADARAQVARDPSKTEAQQVLMVAQEAEKLMHASTLSFDGARKRLTDGIKAINEMLDGPLVAKADNNISAEIRAHFKNLPSSDKRGAALEAAVNAKDLTVLQAVLGAPAMLSGIRPEIQKHYIRTYREAMQPEQAQRLKVMHAALDLVDKYAGLAHTEIERAMGARWNVVQRLRKASSASEAALLLINDPVQS